MIGYQRNPEPPEEVDDSVYTCFECGDPIPGGEEFYMVENKPYCAECIRSMRDYAPYKGEV